MNEPPDVEIGPLKIWVHGREFEDEQDYWEGNELHSTARCEADGCSVRVKGPLLHAGELAEFIKACDALPEGKAELSPTERLLNVRVDGLDVCVEITPDRLTQEHRFHFTLDRDLLPGFVACLRGILTTYPVRGL